jgi:hypothetical protein
MSTRARTPRLRAAPMRGTPAGGTGARAERGGRVEMSEVECSACSRRRAACVRRERIASLLNARREPASAVSPEPVNFGWPTTQTPRERIGMIGAAEEREEMRLPLPRLRATSARSGSPPR